MFGHRKAQPKEEHPSALHPEMQQVDAVTVAVDECCASLERIHRMLNPPQGGDATIPINRVPWSDLPISPLTGLPYDPELLNRPSNPDLDIRRG